VEGHGIRVTVATARDDYYDQRDQNPKTRKVQCDEIWPSGRGGYAWVIKIYGTERAGEARYSPAACNGMQEKHMYGVADSRHISTSHAERQNLTMRMQMRRFAGLANAFSKKVENHAHNVAVHFMHHNFCRVHQTLRVTPAMQAGLANRVWEIEDLSALVESEEMRAIENGELKRGKYRLKEAD
jgi:hypothetical protein